MTIYLKYIDKMAWLEKPTPFPLPHVVPRGDYYLDNCVPKYQRVPDIAIAATKRRISAIAAKTRICGISICQTRQIPAPETKVFISQIGPCL